VAVPAGVLAEVLGALDVVPGGLVAGAGWRPVVVVTDGDGDGDRDGPDEAFVALPASFPPAAPPMTIRRKTAAIQLATCAQVGSDRKRRHQPRR
jgi:hypothetical protein